MYAELKNIFSRFPNGVDSALEGDLEQVQKCLTLGANVNATNEEGLTALHSSSCNGHGSIVKFLIENGADVNSVGPFFLSFLLPLFQVCGVFWGGCRLMTIRGLRCTVQPVLVRWLSRGTWLFTEPTWMPQTKTGTHRWPSRLRKRQSGTSKVSPLFFSFCSRWSMIHSSKLPFCFVKRN